MLLKKGKPVKVGFKVLKDVEMLEIKQGPYSLSKDKKLIQNVEENRNFYLLYLVIGKNGIAIADLLIN